ncbi:MAG TPA: beta-ketoacyl-ACP synthase II [Planctomycetia bacterium]|nr:beta-ketoacyl-ACP synthase II [Planctomycetia bacterium]
MTGMAALTPFGRELTGFWQAICDGRSGIGPIERFDTSRFKTHFAGEIKNFDPHPFLDPKEQKRHDRFSQFAMVASALAVRDAGLDFDREDPHRCGVILGSGVGGLDQFEEAHERLAENPSRLPPMLIPRMIINSASGSVAIQFGLRGQNSAVATACASGSNAIGDAFRAIQYGAAEVMLCGGAEAAITPLAIGGFGAMRALSQRNENPPGASRPFARDRDGFVLSEGAGIVVLEELEHARRRRARIYAEMLGYGSTADGVHITAPDPEGKGAASAMRLALRDAMLPAREVGYVNAHGTGTPLGDRAETVAVKTVFGPAAGRVMVSSTKSQLGHLLGASGGVEFIISALSLYHGVAPPTINLEEPDPDCDLDYVPFTARSLPLIYAMSNSFGFGGQNASLVLGALDETPQRAALARAA